MTIMQRRLQNDEAKTTMLTDMKCNEVAYLPIFIAATFFLSYLFAEIQYFTVNNNNKFLVVR